MVAVSENEVNDNHQKLAAQGLFVEPTSATVAAALNKMHRMIKPGETVVAVLTGHGLKNPPLVD